MANQPSNVNSSWKSSNGEISKSSSAEKKWVDAWIRWPEDEQRNQSIDTTTVGNDDDDDNDDNNELNINPFAEDPRQSFTFSYGNGINISLEGYSDESNEAWNSTGLTLWRSASYLCNFLVENDELIQNKRILELGSGLGLCGILAHQLSYQSGSEVVITDGDTDVLKSLRENVKRNQCNECVSAHQLLWGQDTTQQFLERYRQYSFQQSMPGEVTNIRLELDCGSKTTYFQCMFDIIIASDVVYVATILPPLFETVQTLLAKPKGVFLFAYCSRRDVPVNIDMVLKQSIDAGLTHELVSATDGIFIYSFSWNS